MLRNSFQQVPGVGRTTEKRIWDSGATSWKGFAESPPDFLGKGRTALVLSHLDDSLAALESGDAQYFGSLLPPGEHWRLFDEFRDSCAYVDIETTGLGGYGDIITTIALYDGSSVRWYVNGDNLDDFVRDVSDYPILISYNGKAFDVPFMNRFFGIRLSQVQLDLRYILRGLGFSGGLKSCERQLGLFREGAVADVDGFFAVVLWNEYRRTGSRKVLDTLLAYNIADTVNLECLMVAAYNMKTDRMPFEVKPVSAGSGCENPFQADPGVVSSLGGGMRW